MKTRRLQKKWMPISCIIVVSLFLWLTGAYAQEKEKPQTKQQAVYTFSQIDIIGQVQRPSAMYFLQKAKIDYYGDISLRRSFISDVINSVIDEHFNTSENQVPKTLLRSYDK